MNVPQLHQTRIPVLDKGWIELVDFMPHPATGVSGDLAIVNAARVSFMGESKGDEADRKLLFYLMRNQHSSPFEMCEFKFRVKAPLMVWWQWTRHRTFKYQSANAQSGRYTEFEEGDCYIPADWRKQSKSNKQASDGIIDDEVIKDALDEFLIDAYRRGYQAYEYAIQNGVSKEMACLFLPGFAVYYTWVISVDASNLMNFLRLRMAHDAQEEIRVYAEAIYSIFKWMLPWTAEAFELYVLNETK